MKYLCAHCGLEFDGGWTDAEANAEAEKYFGVKDASTNPQMVVVCDPCFKKMHPADFPGLAQAAKEMMKRD